MTLRSWLTDDCQILEAAGFEPVAYDRIQLKDHYRPVWNHCHLMGLDELCGRLEEARADGEGARAMREGLTQLSFEFNQGASIDAKWFVMVCQKPRP